MSENNLKVDPCRLFEIEQFICEGVRNQNSPPIVKCFPFPRIFRMCPGRPAVEVTTLVDVNVETGEVNVPSRASEMLPKGRPWWDVAPVPTSPE